MIITATRVDHKEKVVQLKANPGKWRKINTYGTHKSAATAASNIAHGVGALGGPTKPYALKRRGGTYETKILHDTTVWARYIK